MILLSTGVFELLPYRNYLDIHWPFFFFNYYYLWACLIIKIIQSNRVARLRRKKRTRWKYVYFKFNRFIEGWWSVHRSKCTCYPLVAQPWKNKYMHTAFIGVKRTSGSHFLLIRCTWIISKCAHLYEIRKIGSFLVCSINPDTNCNTRQSRGGCRSKFTLRSDGVMLRASVKKPKCVKY